MTIRCDCRSALSTMGAGIDVLGSYIGFTDFKTASVICELVVGLPLRTSWARREQALDSAARAARNWVRGLAQIEDLKGLSGFPSFGVGDAFIAIQGRQPLQTLRVVDTDINVVKQESAGLTKPREFQLSKRCIICRQQLHLAGVSLDQGLNQGVDLLRAGVVRLQGDRQSMAKRVAA